MDKPFELQFYEVLNDRCELTSNCKWIFRNQKVGYVGHTTFLDLIKPFIPDRFALVNDIFFEQAYKSTQLDTLLITEDKIIHFEVKNLLSQYEYKNGFWYNKGERIRNNFFTQVDRAGDALEKVIYKERLHVPVDSQLVFINEDDTVKISDEIGASSYLKRWEIRSFLKNEFKSSQSGAMNPHEVAKFLRSKSVEAHEVLDLEGKELRDQARQGILCEVCGGHRIDTQTRRYHIRCLSCETLESKQRAVLRTICDIGVLYYDQPLSKKFVMSFIGERGLEQIIKRTLRQYFELIPKGKASTYINPVKRMEFCFKGIEFRYKKI